MSPRILLLLTCYLGLIAGGLVLGWRLPDMLSLGSRSDGPMGMMLALVWVVYLAASALPFVPGAEIGMGLIAAFGIRVAIWVYLGMVGAMMLAFLAGRLVPADRLARGFALLGLNRAATLVRDAEGLTAAQRERYMVERAPHRWVPVLLRHRYLALALALNLPGNALVGGGGGLALFAGMSGLYRPGPFLATILLAAAPLPVLVIATGYAPMG